MQHALPVYSKSGSIDNKLTARNASYLMIDGRIKQKVVASKMRVPESFLSELLTNKRIWSEPMATRFLKALNGKPTKKKEIVYE